MSPNDLNLVLWFKIVKKITLTVKIAQKGLPSPREPYGALIMSRNQETDRSYQTKFTEYKLVSSKKKF